MSLVTPKAKFVCAWLTSAVFNEEAKARLSPSNPQAPNQPVIWPFCSRSGSHRWNLYLEIAFFKKWKFKTQSTGSHNDKTDVLPRPGAGVPQLLTGAWRKASTHPPEPEFTDHAYLKVMGPSHLCLLAMLWTSGPVRHVSSNIKSVLQMFSDCKNKGLQEENM